MNQPLANFFRPNKIEDMVGQEHLIGKNGILLKCLKEERIPNMIFFGQPGVGKTTLARIIAEQTGMTYLKLNAVNNGLKEIREAIATSLKEPNDKGLLVAIDEIQAMNKKSQQSLLDITENGRITLIANTADNPFFVIYSGLLSRSMIFEFKPITFKDISKRLSTIIKSYNLQHPELEIILEESLLNQIAEQSGGDLRSAIGQLDLCITCGKNGNQINLTAETLQQCSNHTLLKFSEDDTYSILSAFHKSLRGSDPDAAIHYLARLIKAGDLLNITRRLLCVASEDVGLAVPQAISITEACVSAALRLGLPEARIPLAEATIYLAQCPKSDSAIVAIDKALSDLDKINTDIPNHLKDTHYSSAKKIERGKAYKYPHDYPNHFVDQQYLPDAIKDKKYYIPGNNKSEQSYQAFINSLKTK